MSKREGSFRLLNCQRCGAQVRLCVSCDRGQRYCGDCASQAARDRMKRAGQRYQATPRGRENHAARQRRYRQRQAEQRREVTHRGRLDEGQSDVAPPHPEHLDTTATSTTPMRVDSNTVARGLTASVSSANGPAAAFASRPRCSRCAGCCPPFARRQSLSEGRRRKRRPRVLSPP